MKLNKLLFFILIFIELSKVFAATDCNQVTQIPQNECNALIEFYNNTDGQNWNQTGEPKYGGWNRGNMPCFFWHGVYCSGGHVVSLILPDNNLSNSISGLDGLSNLQELVLSGNVLSGPIPPELGRLRNLQYLDLSHNPLSGPIPPELGNLSNLKYIDLSYDRLRGNIPLSLMNLTRLQTIQLEGNILIINNLDPTLKTFLNSRNAVWEPQEPTTDCAQVTEIPQSECESLVALYNSTNGLGWNSESNWDGTNWNVGDEPCRWYGIRCSSGHISSIVLYYNQLNGLIPPELGKLSNLQNLSLIGNQLSGLIPPELGNLGNLQKFDLSLNQLSGSIPLGIGKLSNLQWLDLSNNQLCGNIPHSLINLNKSYHLWLQNNALNIDNFDSALRTFLNSHNAIWKPQNPAPTICKASLATLASFDALPVSTGILLKWQTMVETDNAGFFIWRGQPNGSQCTSQLADYHDIVPVGFEISQGNGFSGTAYFYEDNTVTPETTYCYLLEDRDFGAHSTFHWDFIVSAQVGWVEERNPAYSR